MTAAAPTPESPPSLEAAMLALCGAAREGRTIDPTDVAKAYAAARGEDDSAWRSHLQEVRRAAVRLALAGRIVITRKARSSTRRISVGSTASARRAATN